ncbi:hypothetical protein SAMN05216390_102201 [Lachnospiraceae bacterium KH1T2]|nr:hypothetical protein SAMN05216390_102201 [Lachnospiraceae bacterium KH1T2]
MNNSDKLELENAVKLYCAVTHSQFLFVNDDLTIGYRLPNEKTEILNIREFAKRVLEL